MHGPNVLRRDPARIVVPRRLDWTNPELSQTPKILTPIIFCCLTYEHFLGGMTLGTLGKQFDVMTAHLFHKACF